RHAAALAIILVSRAGEPRYARNFVVVARARWIWLGTSALLGEWDRAGDRSRVDHRNPGRSANKRVVRLALASAPIAVGMGGRRRRRQAGLSGESGALLAAATWRVSSHGAGCGTSMAPEWKVALRLRNVAGASCWSDRCRRGFGPGPAACRNAASE